jgi:AraC-like DNA-binding protein
VETLGLRKGISLVLSQIDHGEACQFHYVEPEDMFGIGFHLKGGSRFEMDRCQLETQPLEVWASATPRSAASSFTFSQHGFRTVSLRFSLDAVHELLHQHRQETGLIADMARLAEHEVMVARLASLDPNAAQIVEAMFATPYIGAARTLFLESCALGLLAAQIDAASRVESPMTTGADQRHRERMLGAREHLDVHFADPPTIAKLARIVGTNEFALKRGFKEAFGLTIFGYVRQRRMEHAIADLHAGRSVEDAAHAAGYECPRCFADAFRRHFGVLPSAVTRQARLEISAHRS